MKTDSEGVIPPGWGYCQFVDCPKERKALALDDMILFQSPVVNLHFCSEACRNGFLKNNRFNLFLENTKKKYG